MRVSRLIHVGHHKCASTWLQQQVFPKIKELKCWSPEAARGGLPERSDLLRYLTHKSDLFYEKEKVEPQIRNFASSYNCISYEGFLGHGLLEITSGFQIKTIASRLNQIFPDAGIFIVVRNQKDWIKSLYRNDVLMGAVPDFRTWFYRRKDFFQLDWCRYDSIVDLYRNIYGEGNVHVCLFEDLFQTDSIDDLLTKFEIDREGIFDIDFTYSENVGKAGLALTFNRLVNRFMGNKLNLGAGVAYSSYRRFSPILDPFLSKWESPSQLVFEGFERELSELYGESNARLSVLLNQDLTKRGYS